MVAAARGGGAYCQRNYPQSGSEIIAASSVENARQHYHVRENGSRHSAVLVANETAHRRRIERHEQHQPQKAGPSDPPFGASLGSLTISG